jgi:hypothetical protein
MSLLGVAPGRIAHLLYHVDLDEVSQIRRVAEQRVVGTILVSPRLT